MIDPATEIVGKTIKTLRSEKRERLLHQNVHYTKKCTLYKDGSFLYILTGVDC